MRKWIISMLCVLGMVLLGMPMVADAAEEWNPVKSVKIGGVELNESTPYYHNGAEGVPGEADNVSTGANATFNPVTGTLTLNGLNIVSGEASEKGIWWEYSVTSRAKDLRIVLADGTTNTAVNTVATSVNGESGLGDGASLIIEGSGTLNISGGTYGIWVYCDATIQGNAKVNVTGDSKGGIYNNDSDGLITIKDNAEVTVTGGAYGIGYDNYDFNANTPLIQGGTVIVTGGTGAFRVAPSLEENTKWQVSVGDSAENSLVWNGLTGLNNYKYVKLVDSGNKTALSGTATITGTAKYDETLTAELTDTSLTDAEKATLVYQWKRDGVDIGTKSSGTQYVLTADDVGKTITVEISTYMYSGSKTSAATNVVEKADAPAAPTGLTGVKPSEQGRSDGKITGVTNAMEYSTTTDFSSKIACSGTEITGLAASTYYVRIAETASTNAGAYTTVVVEEGPVHVCAPNLTSGTPATCTTDGWKDYYQCSCNKYFTDAAGTDEITDLDAWKVGDGKIPATDHSYSTNWSYDADEHWYASTCGHDVVSGSEAHHGGTATCTEAAVCVDCGQSYGTSAGHSGTPVAGQASDCTTDGWKDCYQCDGCDKYFSDEACNNEITNLGTWKTEDGKIPASGHNFTWYITKDATETEKGQMTGFCTVCSHTDTKETPVVQETTGSGDVLVLSPEANANKAQITNTEEVKKSVLLTDDERDAVVGGSNLSIILETTDITATVETDAKAKLDANLGDYTAGMYMDISLWKQVGTQQRSYVEKTAEQVVIAITIPESLRAGSNVTRAYKVLKLHNGVVTAIDATYEATNFKLTFATDEFSTYSLVYKDTQNVPQPTAVPTAVPTAEPTATPTVVPTAEPTATPTVAPTAEPTATPTVAPTAEPTATPTVVPTAEPTVTPTVAPTAEPEEDEEEEQPQVTEQPVEDEKDESPKTGDTSSVSGWLYLMIFSAIGMIIAGVKGRTLFKKDK